MKYRKKPVVIEAIQWTGENEIEARDFFQFGPTPGAPQDGNIIISTLEGTMIASPGDWLIRGVKGEIYPCKPDIFAETYDPA